MTLLVNLILPQAKAEANEEHLKKAALFHEKFLVRTATSLRNYPSTVILICRLRAASSSKIWQAVRQHAGREIGQLTVLWTATRCPENGHQCFVEIRFPANACDHIAVMTSVKELSTGS